MSNQVIRHFKWTFTILILLLSSTLCASQVSGLGASSLASAPPRAVLMETTFSTSSVESSSATSLTATPTTEPPVDQGLPYEDGFNSPSGNWPAETSEDYLTGYAEPDYYSIENQSSYYRKLVFVPGKPIFKNITIESKVFRDASNTDLTRNFRYGVVFRRMGDRYYAFTISPTTGSWYLLKSSPTDLVVLREGKDSSIQGHDLETEDMLRVDANGAKFYLYINDHLVDLFVDQILEQIIEQSSNPEYKSSHPEYTQGEVGFYVETLDSTRAHILFDSITIRNVQATASPAAVLFQEDFNPPSGDWLVENSGDYLTGYNKEAGQYYIENQSSFNKKLVFVPGKRSFADAILHASVLSDVPNTDWNGDLRYGLVFRRLGDQYYAFTISPATKKWYVLKSSPNALVVLKEGIDPGIRGNEDDTLLVNAEGPMFSFYINSDLVERVRDSEYKSGEVGLYVETLASTRAHILFNSIVIRDIQPKCIFPHTALYLRSGPAITSPARSYLIPGDALEPLGSSPDRKWIRVIVARTNRLGWVFADWVSCNIPLSRLPVIRP